VLTTLSQRELQIGTRLPHGRLLTMDPRIVLARAPGLPSSGPWARDLALRAKRIRSSGPPGMIRPCWSLLPRKSERLSQFAPRGPSSRFETEDPISKSLTEFRMFLRTEPSGAIPKITSEGCLEEPFDIDFSVRFRKKLSLRLQPKQALATFQGQRPPQNDREASRRLPDDYICRWAWSASSARSRR